MMVTIPALIVVFALTMVTAILSITGSGGKIDPSTNNVTTPSNLILIVPAESKTELDLTFNASETDGSGSIDYYLITYWESSEESSTKESIKESDGLSHKFTGLSENTSYSVQVIAIDTDGNTSKNSNVVSKTTGDDTPPPVVVVPVPANFNLISVDEMSLKASYESVTVESDVINYDVRWSKTADGYSEGWETDGITGLEYIIGSSSEPLDPITTYYAEVRANDVTKAKKSDWSTESSATTKDIPSPEDIPVPANFTLTSINESSLKAKYESVEVDTDEINYEVRWSKTTDGYSEGWETDGITDLEYTIDDSLEAGVVYYAEVRANDVTKAKKSDWSTESSATTDPVVDPIPTVPADLAVVVDTTDSEHALDVTFAESTITKGTIDKYVVSYKKSDDADAWVEKDTVSSPYTIKELVKGTSYDVRVKAVSNLQKESAWTTVVQCSTEDSAIVGPTKPLITSIDADGSNKLNIDFTDSTSSGSTITNYDIDSKEKGEAEYTVHESTTDSTSSYVLSGLIADREYTVRVRAVDDKGQQSDWSDESDGKTDPSTANFPELPSTVAIPDLTFKSEHGYGNGRKWGAKSFAPFVDMGDYWGWDSGKGGLVPNLVDMADVAKNTEFQLGFVDSLGGTADGLYDDSGDIVKWAWAGNPLLAPYPEGDAGDHSQFDNIGSAIKDYRNAGGDVSISIGGASGVPFWDESQNISQLERTYEEIIKYYGLSTIDLDIEGNGMNVENNKINAKAIKQVQLDTGVDVTLTLPIGRKGLDSGGIGPQILQEYVDEGVDIKYVNAMAMVFDDDIGSGNNNPIDQWANEGMESLNAQIVSAYTTAGKTITSEEAYLKEGSITSIGKERDDLTIETGDMFKNVVDFAKDKGIGMMSYWAENRDVWDMNETSHYFKNDGVKSRGEFSKVVQDEGFITDQLESINAKPSTSLNATPLAVDNLDVSAGFDDVTVTWDNPSGNDDSIFYDVYLAKEDDSEYKFVGRTSGETLHIPNLEGGDWEYTVDVAATNSTGEHVFTKTKPIFGIKDYSSDSVPPVFGSTAEIKPQEVVTYYTDKYLTFNQATDGESSVAKYDIAVTGGSFPEKDISIKTNDWYGYDNVNFGVLTDYTMAAWNLKGKIDWGLDPASDYHIKIIASDVNDNASDPLEYDFRTDDVVDFDVNQSLDNKYHLGMIVHYEGTDGKHDYQKIKPWGGYAPDEYPHDRFNWDGTAGGPDGFPSEMTAWWNEDVSPPSPPKYNEEAINTLLISWQNVVVISPINTLRSEM